MRFLAFLLMLLVLTLIVLYVIGDRRQPQQRVIVMPVELEAKETPR